MSSYPNLALRKVKIEQKEDRLARKKSLYIVCNELFADVDHLVDQGERRISTLQYWTLSISSS
jgi:hypothetical protein